MAGGPRAAGPSANMSQLQIVPISLREANEYVASYHRHNTPTARNGGKFAIGLDFEGKLVGVAIVGHPLSATFMDGYTAEVLRTCTGPGAPLGSVSKLYARCWRIWQAMGGRRLVTYTLPSESGASLRGAGWKIVGQTEPIADCHWRKHNQSHIKRQWQPVLGQQKFRWEINA